MTAITFTEQLTPAQVLALIRGHLEGKAAALRESADESLKLDQAMSAGVEYIQADVCDEIAEQLQDWVPT